MPVDPPEKKGILELLDPKTPLKTPSFQRSYAWRKAEVDEYWNDLWRAIEVSGDPEYFLGLVVVDNDGFIQDGQQRLATTLLLATAIYEAIESAKSDGQFDAQLAKDAIGAVSPSLRTSPSSALQIGLADQQELLGRAGVQSGTAESTKRLKAARALLKEKIEFELALLQSPDAKLGRLKRWGDFLQAGAYVVVLNVPPKDAHNIFETLNTRGVQLPSGDLVKSHLIGRSNNVALAVSKWQDLTSALAGTDGAYEAELDTFLLHYFGSRYQRTTRRDLFTDYRTAARDLDSVDAIEALTESARFYRALVAPEDETSYWNGIGVGAQHAIELLNGLGLKQLRYLLLAILRDFGADLTPANQRKRQRQALIAIAAWSVRGLVIGKTGGSAEEKTYIDAAQRIRDRQIKSVDHLRTYFKDREMFVEDDKSFQERFFDFSWDRPTSHTRARAILLAMERQQAGSKAGSVPAASLTLEHVLPQSPADGTWKNFNTAERLELTNSIGNLLLIEGPSGANNQLGVAEWSEKRRMMNGFGPQTVLTTEAMKLTTWTPTTIRTRRKRLSKVAVLSWPA